MSKEADIIAVVTARGGSEGVPRKNVRPLYGKPLIAYTIEAALGSRYIDRVIVSTEDEEIARIAGEYGAEVIERPPELAQNDTPTIDVLHQVIKHLEEVENLHPDTIVVLQPTSPLRTSGDIDGAIRKFQDTGRKSVVSICPAEHPLQWTYKLEKEKLKPAVGGGEPVTRRQDTQEAYRLNGAVYVVNRDTVLRQDKLVNDDTVAYIMPAERSVDIDTELDFKLAELLMQERAAPDIVQIGNRSVGKDRPCFIIAEAGVNHNGDVNLAKKLIDAAREAGADAVKFQTFRADSVVTRDAMKARYQEATTGKEETQFEMIKKLEISPKDFEELSGYAQEKGIIFLSTPFDRESVDLLDKLKVPAFKVGSGEITNFPLLRHIARKGRPVLLSTGMSTLNEVAEALEVIHGEGMKEIIVFHCVSDYPARIESINLKALETLRRTFGLPVGLSDHSTSITVPVAAFALGACVIEKHFTLDKKLPGPDHRASLEPAEFKEMVRAIRDIEKAMGDGIKKPTKEEAANIKVVRRSIIARVDIPSGTTITGDMLDIKRPADGIEPRHLDAVLGKKAKKDIASGSPLTWDKIHR